MRSRLAFVAALLVPFAIACSSSDEGSSGGADEQNLTARPGELNGTCGGFAGITCKEGLRCEMTATHPDAAGRCIAADDGPPATCLAMPSCDPIHVESDTPCVDAEGADCKGESMCGRTVYCRNVVHVEGTLVQSVGIGGENTGMSIETANGLVELVLGDHQGEFVAGRFAKVSGVKKPLTGVETGTRIAIEVQKILACPAPTTINCMPPISPSNTTCGDDRGWIQDKCDGVSYVD